MRRFVVATAIVGACAALACFVQGSRIGAPCNGIDGEEACENGQTCSLEMGGVCVDESCLSGQRECPCRPDGSCDEGLQCDATNVCESMPPCTPGYENCPCDGNACVAGLTCNMDNKCVEPLAPAAEDGVDILVVMDNSGSMGEEQAAFVQQLAELITPLDEAEVDWRVGVTTTDDGNMWCAGTTPESGQLGIESCRSRDEEFESLDGMTNVFEATCTDLCELDSITLAEMSLPGDEGGPRPRPWIERIDGMTNVVDADPLDALRCAVPQGIAGCGFESPLDAMKKAIERASVPGEGGFGFLRPKANLVVIFVTDEVDCSTQDQAIFAPEGNRVFWSDPDAAFPTSAVCFNAGTACMGDPLDCVPQDYDINGNVALTFDESVLYSLTQYTGQLHAVEMTQKRVMVVEINGLQKGGTPTYSMNNDLFVGDFGVDPGCDEGNDAAVPPVRLHALANEFRGLESAPIGVSICEDDYELDEVAEAILEYVQE